MGSEFDLDMVGVIEGTDKSSTVTYAWDYLRHYARLFESFRVKPINVVEIGVFGGSSLKVWKSYFTRARIVGVDINADCARFADDRVTIEIGSQDDPGFLAQVCAKYPPTIIIDDGSHRADHIVYTFERMFPSLLPGGIYVVEDLAFHFGEQANRWKGVEEQSPPDYFLRIARSCLARSVQGGPDWGNAHYYQQHIDSIEFVRGLVVIHKQTARRDLNSSLAFADEYLSNRPADAAAHERLCQFILRQSGPLERAEAEIRQAIALGGETASRLRLYSDIRRQQQRLPEAADLAEQAAGVSGEAHVWLHAGSLRMHQGDLAAAVRAFRRAAAIQPGTPLTALRLSETLERLGNTAEALAAARQGLPNAPGTDIEEQLRARVERLRAKVRE